MSGRVPPADVSRADDASYAPLSALAVGGFIVSGIAAVLIIGTVAAGRASGKPAFHPWLLLICITGLIVSWLARRQVIGSEGASSGRGIAGAGIWLSVLAGGCYGVYLFAIDLALRNQATAFARQWFETAATGTAESAFLLTLDAPTRQGLSDQDPAGLRTRFGRELMSFDTLEIVRLLRRSGGKFAVDVKGVREWSLQTGGFKVDLALALHTPEGRFDYVFPVFGRDTPELGGRTWQALLPRAELTDYKYTTLGRLMFGLQVEGRRHIVKWVQDINEGRLLAAYRETLAAADRAAASDASPGFADFKSGALIRVDGKPPSPEQRQLFNTGVFLQPGINVNPGTATFRVGPPALTFSPGRVLLDHSTEIAAQGIGPVVSHVLVEVADAGLVEEVEKHRNAAEWKGVGADASRSPADELVRFPKLSFRVVAVDVRPDAPRLGQPSPGQPPSGP